MKKMMLTVILPFIFGVCSAQEKGLQKIAFGTVFASSGTVKLSGELKPFALGYNLSPNIIFVTTKTFHNVLYGFGNNAVRAVNGYFPGKNLDIYIVLQKSFGSKSAYASLGIEKMVRAGDVNFFLYSEIGASSYPTTNLITIGVHANIQTPIWKRK